VTFDKKRITDRLASPGYSPMRRKELFKALRAEEPTYHEFRSALDELVDEGVVVLGRGRRYTLAAASGMFTGRIEVKRGQYGFVRSREAGAGELFVPPDSTGDALDGDTVLVRTAKSRGRRIARVEKVVSRARRTIAGVFVSTGDGGVVIPDYRALPEFEIAPQDTGDATDGEKVLCEPLPRVYGSPPVARVVRMLGTAGTWSAERAARVEEFGLRTEFSDEVEGEAGSVSADITAEEAARRADHTSEMVVAIDPDDARDHDDAFTVRRNDDGTWLLRVHIADVAHYVPVGCAIDREARLRGTSVYLPGEVFRMLPDRLSADVCSLLEGKRRLVKTVNMRYTADGRRSSFSIERSVIETKRTLAYGRVFRALEEEPISEIDGESLDMLRQARELHELLRAARARNGSLDFSFPEVRVTLSPQGEVTGIVRRASDFTHHMVEEFMLEANRCVAELCVDWGLGALHRIHEEPDERSLEAFAESARDMGYAIKRPYTRQKLRELIDRATERGESGEAVTFALLRALKLARYYEHSVGHYALAFDRYLHFTSPIRRYPDLIVHRALDAVFPPGRAALPRRKPASVSPIDGDALTELAHLAEHCSNRERAAEKAEQELTRFRQLEFLKEHAGGVIDAAIRSVDEYGLTVELEEFWVRSRAPVSKLPAYRYRYDAKRGVLKGKRSRYRSGDRIRTRVVEVDLVAREVVVAVLLG
jgi:ribonuclease R